MKNSVKTLELLLQDKIPDMNSFFSEAIISVYPQVLEMLLLQERSKFERLLEIDDEKICFKIFEEASKLSYAWSIFTHIDNVHSSQTTRKIIEIFEPKYLEFSQQVSFSMRYYSMIKICLEKWWLNNEQTKILQDAIKSYELRWIHLEKKDQDSLRDIEQKLAELSRKFSENTLLSEAEISFHIDDEESIIELPKDIREDAKHKAILEWKTGYSFGSSFSEYIAIMKYCSDKKLRKKLATQRGKIASFWKYDNRFHVLEILQLRQKKAEILWYKDYSELSLNFKMADNAQEILKILDNIAKRSKKKGQKEISDLKDYFQLKDLDLEDLAYYFRRYKEEKYKIDEDKLKEYFEYSSVLEWMFTVMKKLYNIELQEVTSENDKKRDIQIFEVYKEEKLISYFMIDPFFREEKRSWAWANNLREKSKWQTPFVINVYNLKKGKDCTLLRMSEVETMFHEFWHAMHEMFSLSEYSELSWFNVELDFVEVPSQFHEHFCQESESLQVFARHYKNNSAIPDKFIDSLQEVKYVDSWNMVLTQCIYAMLDIYLHFQKKFESIEELDDYILAQINSRSFFKRDKEYKMYTSFSHIFDGGYACGYYSYIWSEILELDIWKEFQESGIFNSTISKKFYDSILSQWSKKQAKNLYFDFTSKPMSLDGFFQSKWM